MDELDVDRAAVFGHSYGGVLALALAAAHPERVEAVIAYEPPRFGDSETAGSRRANEIGGLVRAAHAQGGAAATAEVFLAAIGAADVLASASPSTRAAILSEGDGVLADVGAIETAVFDPAAIPCPVTLITGDAGESFYGPIANAAASAIPNATRVRLAGLAHNAPIMQPAAIAEVILAALTRD
jgi:pimeloyl-ACP methyl ester carboxylesterase